jgi:hypothetical protein
MPALANLLNSDFHRSPDRRRSPDWKAPRTSEDKKALRKQRKEKRYLPLRKARNSGKKLKDHEERNRKISHRFTQIYTDEKALRTRR